MRAAGVKTAVGQRGGERARRGGGRRGGEQSRGGRRNHELPEDGDGKEAILRRRPCALAVQDRQSAGQLNRGSGPFTG